MMAMEETVRRVDVVVVGAGAAGLMCAYQAGRVGKKVLVLEVGARVGRKVLLSGGGKSNFSNRDCRAEHFISSNRHFCKSALAQFSAKDFLNWIEQHGIDYEERAFGRLFCQGGAEEIVQALMRDCEPCGVEVRCGVGVEEVEKKETGFVVRTTGGAIETKALVVATGGLSYPQAGATGWGYGIAEQFGLEVVECRPGLVPLLFSRDDEVELRELTGIALEAVVSCGKKMFRENVLFTHFGLSGPAILQISNYWQAGQAVRIDWLPKVNVVAVLTRAKQYNGRVTVEKALEGLLPERMLRLWGKRYFEKKAVAECSLGQLEAAAESLQGWVFEPRGTDGYNKAEVTLGGVSTDELSSKTMEARQAAGLYFVGEVVDVTGQLGGYNLQWAWSSGFAAGKACGEAIRWV